MIVRARALDEPHRIPRNKWHFVDDVTVSLEGGFELGRIYGVVYRARDPRVLGCLKYSQDENNPLPGLRVASGWGVSESGRLLLHFLYEGFNADAKSSTA